MLISNTEPPRPAPEYVGLTVGTAEDLAQDQSMVLRPARPGQARRLDYRPDDRITVYVDDHDVVTRAERG